MAIVIIPVGNGETAWDRLPLTVANQNETKNVQVLTPIAVVHINQPPTNRDPVA